MGVPIVKRDRKSGATKRKQEDVEADLARAKRMSYNRIIERVFLDRYRPGDTEVGFIREYLVDAARDLSAPIPRNLGDVLYT